MNLPYDLAFVVSLGQVVIKRFVSLAFLFVLYDTFM